MTYAERLALFVKSTGHRPGEMNKSWVVHRTTVATKVDLDGDSREETGDVSLEPPAQSAGPGRCNRFCFDRSKSWDGSDPTPCKLDAGHEGAHEP